MRTAAALLLFSALFLSLGPIQPLAKAAIPSAPANCCTKMEDGEKKGDCGQKMPRSKEERRCCDACMLGLALYLDRPAGFLAPPNREEIFAAFICQDRSRSERPPTPPPRSLFS